MTPASLTLRERSAPRQLRALALAAACTAAAWTAGLGDPGPSRAARALAVVAGTCLALALVALAAELPSALRRHGVIDASVRTPAAAALTSTSLPALPAPPAAGAVYSSPRKRA